MTLRTWLKVAWRSSEHLPWWLRTYRVLRWCPWKLAVLLLLALSACAYDPHRVVVDCHDVIPLDTARYGPNVCNSDGGAK